MSKTEIVEHSEDRPNFRTDAVVAHEAAAVRRRWVLFALQIAFGVFIISFWEYASGALIDPFFISSPSAVVLRLYEWITDGTLATHLWITLYATFAGFTIGSIIGFTLGFLFGRWDAIATIFDPYVTALYCLPKIALTPLFIMWFGIGIESKIAMSAVIVFFLVFLNTFGGVRDVAQIYINTVRIMGANEWQLLRSVIMPSASAWVLTGLKVSVPYALIGAVVGEFMSSNRGIGFLIAQASGIFDTASVFAGLVVLATSGAIISAGLKKFEAHTLRWR